MSERKHNHFAVEGLPKFLYHNRIDQIFFAHVQSVWTLSKQLDKTMTFPQAVEHFRQTYSLDPSEYNDIKARRIYYLMLRQYREMRRQIRKNCAGDGQSRK